MTLPEEQVRELLHSTAAAVTPESVPRLTLPGTRWRLQPRVTISAIVIVVALAVTAAGFGLDRYLGRVNPANRGSVPTSKDLGLDRLGVPRFFVALVGSGRRPLGHPLHAVVGRTSTGASLATIWPPSGYQTFAEVAGSADDRTFVLAAQPWKPVNSQYADNNFNSPMRLFVLRLAADGRPSALSPVRGASFPLGGQLSGMAVSPDGTRLAVAWMPDCNCYPGLTVYGLNDGSARTWTVSGPPIGTVSFNGLWDSQVVSWTAGGRVLAFNWADMTRQGLRLLDLTASGGKLLANSRWAPGPAGVSAFSLLNQDAVITADGSTIISGTSTASALPAPAHLLLESIEYSAINGRTIRVMTSVTVPLGSPDNHPAIFWASPDGGVLIAGPPGDGSWPVSGNSMTVVTANQHLPIHLLSPAAPVVQVAW